ncbi:RNA polymerase sigma factor [uncultured Oscillibacter sp.]|uniref:RNA polymerase sigma factor n=2 Tax=uncultured Oscillibacter sp. TaxID=876091 RepID=UPI0025E96F10|nr:RNA polymerase sigma factor [uncultured Oscillibacter sp.]
MMTESTFTAATERHLDMVYRIALNWFRNPADAEDAAQTVMLKLWQSDTEFADGEHLRRWLARVTLNVCKDMARSPWRRHTVSLEELRSPVFSDGERRAVYREVMALPGKYRVPLYLYYYEGYSVAEIGELLRLNASTVQTRLARARGKLKVTPEEG